jgi:hypothetical protein
LPVPIDFWDRALQQAREGGGGEGLQEARTRAKAYLGGMLSSPASSDEEAVDAGALLRPRRLSASAELCGASPLSAPVQRAAWAPTRPSAGSFAEADAGRAAAVVAGAPRALGTGGLGAGAAAPFLLCRGGRFATPFGPSVPIFFSAGRAAGFLSRSSSAAACARRRQISRDRRAGESGRVGEITRGPSRCALAADRGARARPRRALASRGALLVEARHGRPAVDGCHRPVHPRWGKRRPPAPLAIQVT